MQCVGTLSSYLWGYKTTSSANITSMNAYECNAYVLCLHTSKGMKPHRTPPRATYDAKLYRYGRTIGHDKTSDAKDDEFTMHVNNMRPPQITCVKHILPPLPNNNQHV